MFGNWQSFQPRCKFKSYVVLCQLICFAVPSFMPIRNIRWCNIYPTRKECSRRSRSRCHPIPIRRRILQHFPATFLPKEPCCHLPFIRGKEHHLPKIQLDHPKQQPQRSSNRQGYLQRRRQRLPRCLSRW